MEHESHLKQFHFKDSIPKKVLAGQTDFNRPNQGHSSRFIIKMKENKNYYG